MAAVRRTVTQASKAPWIRIKTGFATPATSDRASHQTSRQDQDYAKSSATLPSSKKDALAESAEDEYKLGEYRRSMRREGADFWPSELASYENFEGWISH